MVKILQIGMTANPGGIESCIMNYYTAIYKKGFSFDFINPYKENLAYSNDILKLGGNIYKISNFKKNPISYYKQLKKILLENKYDVIHMNILSYANILPFIVFRKLKLNNVVVHSHNSNIPGKIRFCLHNINKIYCRHFGVKIACAQEASSFMFGKKESTVIIPNAIDTSKFNFDEEERKNKRKEFAIKNEVVIGCVGRLCKQKNQNFLIEIMKKLKNDNIKLFVVGDFNNEYGKEFNRLVRLNELNNYIITTGVKKDINSYLSFFDFLLMPSIFEGLSVALVEAQSSDLPIFASDKIAKESNITNNIVFLPLDSDIWIRKIKNKKINERRRNLLSNTIFDINLSSNCLIDIYEKIIDDNKNKFG